MLNSKEWTVAFIDYAMSFLEADPAPKNARKLERAQALANELLKIDGWVTLRSKMVAVNAEYPNSGGGMSQHVTSTSSQMSHSSDTLLIAFTKALRTHTANRADYARTDANALRAAQTPISHRTRSQHSGHSQSGSSETVDLDPERAQQFETAGRDAEAYAEGDDRDPIDLEQLRLWGIHPNDVRQLNLTYIQVRNQGRSHDHAMKECRLNSLRRLVTIWNETIYTDGQAPGRPLPDTGEDAIRRYMHTIQTRLRDENWLQTFLFPNGQENAHGPTRALAKRQDMTRYDISTKAETMANQGNLKKALMILRDESKTVTPTQEVVNSKFGRDKMLNQTTDRLNHKFAYDWRMESQQLLVDAEDIRRHVERLRANAAPGASGLSNKDLIGLITGPEGHAALDGITVLINLILRGWLHREDLLLLSKCKGVALDKGNYAQDNTNIRPICIGEVIMSVAHSYVLAVCKEELCKRAGVDSGYQIGLTRDGIPCHNKQMQIIYELDTINGLTGQDATHAILNLDGFNSFNEISRVMLRRFLATDFKQWRNFLVQQYDLDIEVDFGNAIKTEMQTGTQQGCKTSAHLFDAVVHSYLVENNLFKDFSDCQIFAIHDDISFRAPIGRIVHLYNRLVLLLEELGLAVNGNKTKVLFRGDANDPRLTELRQITDQFSSEGMVFGGLPFGSDMFIKNFLISKIEEYEAIVNKVISNSADRNAGTVFSIVRFCLSAKWPHLMRTIPSQIWNIEYQGQTLAKYIDNLSLKCILHHMTLNQFRQEELSQSESDSLFTRLGLRLQNGGLGVHAVHDYCDTAMLGMWASNVDQIMTSLEQFGVTRDAISTTETISRICSNAASLKAKVEHADAFTLAQATDIALRTGKAPTVETLNMLSRDAATNKDDSIRLQKGKGTHQRKLRSTLNLYNANRLTDDIANHETSVAERKRNPYLRAFIAQRGTLANKWLNRIHRSPDDRNLKSPTDVKIAFWNVVGINLIVVNRDCTHCDMKNINWFEHGQMCKKSRKRRKKDNKVVHYTRSWPLHKEIERLCTECWRKIPDVQVVETNPPILDTFPPNPENPPPDKTNPPPREHEEDEPWTDDNQIIADGTARDSKIETADVKIITTFGGNPVPMLIDITVASMHVVHNQGQAVKEKYSSGLADQGAQKKDKKHSHYLTEGNAIGFAFDSMGGISQSAMKFINHLYAKGRGDRKRSWDSEAMRVALRKEFLDRLSMVLCSHRVSDFKYLGIPYVSANGATIYNAPDRPRPARTPSVLPAPSELEPGRFTISRPVGNPG